MAQTYRHGHNDFDNFGYIYHIITSCCLYDAFTGVPGMYLTCIVSCCNSGIFDEVLKRAPELSVFSISYAEFLRDTNVGAQRWEHGFVALTTFFDFNT